MHLGGAATMPGSEEDAATTALVLNVLERVHDIGNASQAAETAETKSPGVCGVSSLEGNVCESPLSACWAIGGSRRSVKRSDGSSGLVRGTALLLRGHTGLGT